jgi:acyl-CoA oxidase
LTERVGWRGMFTFNKISELQLAMKGNSIAEGDVSVLCIRKCSRSHR